MRREEEVRLGRQRKKDREVKRIGGGKQERAKEIAKERSKERAKDRAKIQKIGKKQRDGKDAAEDPRREGY